MKYSHLYTFFCLDTNSVLKTVHYCLVLWEQHDNTRKGSNDRLQVATRPPHVLPERNRGYAYRLGEMFLGNYTLCLSQPTEPRRRPILNSNN